MHHLRAGSGGSYRETIAFLSMWPHYAHWSRLSQNDYYLGAEKQAEELGYRVELFHLAEPGMTPARMSRLLTARGIRGLLVGACREPNGRLELDWKKFSAVTFGYSLAFPSLHRVTTDYHREMLSALHRLESDGCRRIGLVLNISDDAKALNLWRSAYLLFEDQFPPERRIPVHGILPSEDPTMDASSESAAAWMRRYKPDALISAGCDFPRFWERMRGRPAPKRIRYANMNIRHADNRSRGIDQDSWAIGRLACSHLVSMLQRNETALSFAQT